MNQLLANILDHAQILLAFGFVVLLCLLNRLLVGLAHRFTTHLGFLEGPIGITNTHNVGVVRDAIIHWQARNNALFQLWSCPLVTETADGWLNDMNKFHVRAEHVFEALDAAQGAPA